MPKALTHSSLVGAFFMPSRAPPPPLELLLTSANDAVLLKFFQVAERLNCSDSTVRRLVKSGALRPVFIGPSKSSAGQRFRSEDIDAWLEERRPGGGGEAA
jgi:excisionase family DNA binding protein